MFLLAIAGFLAVSADFACNDDSCPTETTARFQSMADIERQRIELLDEALVRSNVTLTAAQRAALARDGHLVGVVQLDRPVKHPDGTVELPPGWLPELPQGHPWRAPLTPADDAFYSWFEERILGARLYDPANPEHATDARAYLAKARSSTPQFVGWTFSTPTECPKKKVVK